MTAQQGVYWEISLPSAAAFRVILALLVAAVTAIGYRRSLSVVGKNDLKAWQPMIDPTVLSFMETSGYLIYWLFVRQYNRQGFSTDILLNILTWYALYFSALSIAVPLLRRRYTARTCALLWLLPCVCHPIIMISSMLLIERPLLVIPLRFYGGHLLWIWLGGAFLMLVYRWAGHFRYRRILLKEAVQPADSVRDLWDRM